MYKVVYMTDNESVGEEVFNSMEEAAEYEQFVLNQGCTTHIIKLENV